MHYLLKSFFKKTTKNWKHSGKGKQLEYEALERSIWTGRATAEKAIWQVRQEIGYPPNNQESWCPRSQYLNCANNRSVSKADATYSTKSMYKLEAWTRDIFN